MSKDTNSTRRSFLKGSALLAVPLAAVAAPAAVLADDNLNARLAKLENEAAIRELHREWLRRINIGARDAAMQLLADSRASAFDPSVRSIAPDHTGEPDAIELAPNGQRASGRFHCVVKIATPIPQDSTLAQMAHAQGTGFIRHTKPRVLHVSYIKSSGSWAIAKAEFAPG